MKDFFKELFEYSHHFNQELVKKVMTHPKCASEKTMKLLSHLINAHGIWNSRIEYKPYAHGVWDIHMPESLAAMDKINYENTLRLLDEVDLNASMNYVNTKGESYTNSIRDVLFHVVNHSTYHRAQIASDFKEHGITPLITDYIFYKR